MNELQSYSFIHLGYTYKKMNIFISVHLLREDSRVSKREHMTNKFIYTAKEYANKLNLTASALRKRRLAGKLEGLYELRNKKYFYADVGPNKDSFSLLNSRSVSKRRNIPRNKTRYTKYALQKANDIKQLMRIQGWMKEEQINHITPDIIEVAKQRHQEELNKKIKQSYPGSYELEQKRAYDKWLMEQDERLESEQKNFKNPFKPGEDREEKEIFYY